MNRLLLVLVVSLLTACAFQQEYSTPSFNVGSLQEGALEQDGLAFLTPSTVTGQEEDTQALALAFATVMKKQRPEIKVVKLSGTLSEINSHHLTDSYKAMYATYRDTGLLNADILKTIGEVTGTRYMVQLKLSTFKQTATSRFNLLGLRVSQTNKSSIRLFMQIWDSETGTIAFEASQELNQARESFDEDPITFKATVDKAAEYMLENMP
ncbi:hypothetical protein ACFSJ3_03365 [Corallincola platygyrae]|uniref:Lipoprotein n=1 Tax=Corallincola platygyrae TaxID=1193278 RepID=A0ABW4XL72_9GAMM